MPTYVLPATEVFQDFTSSATSVANPQRAHIAGGHAYLTRYAETDEREYGNLGYYDPAQDTEYTWGAAAGHKPYRPAGAIIDPDYTKVWIKNALLQYLYNPVGGTYEFTKLTGYRNRIYSADFAFAANGDTYPRTTAVLYDRDVALGDIVKVRVGTTNYWTYVKDLVADKTLATPDPVTADAANADTAVVTADVTFVTEDLTNTVDLVASATNWSAIAHGRVTEVYTVRVMEGSTGGDLTTAKVRLRSASGEDDEDNIVPAVAFGSFFTVGNLGLQIKFTNTAESYESESATSEGIPYIDLVAGQEWTIEVAQAFTANTATPGGNYDRATATTYIIEVTKGGLWADGPQVRITTTNGIDVSGPTTVAGTGAGNVFNVGNYGLTMYFTAGIGLCKGDRFYLDGEAPTAGAYHTLVLGKNLPTDLADGTEVEVNLFIKKDLLQVSQERVFLDGDNNTPVDNWIVEDDLLTVSAGLIAYDDTFTDDGNPVRLEVVSDEDAEYGQLYVEYRAWRSDLCNQIGTFSATDNINDVIEGPLDPDNPLKWGVFKAQENSNGTDVKFSSVCNPASADSWADMLAVLLGRDDVYGLVPLTRDSTVLDLYAAHVAAMSSPEQGLWRVAWFSAAAVPETPLVHNGSTVPGHITSTTDGEACLCTFAGADAPGTAPFVVLECPAGNGNFITNGVQPGDVVRSFYGLTDDDYQSFVVDEVVSEDELKLVTGPEARQSVAIRVEVWRTNSKDQEAAEIATNAGAWSSRRIRYVVPDQIESSGTVQEGYFLCAALAGEASGILPQQGMTNLEVLGFSDVPRTTRFSRPQLDVMAAAGAWIVTQNPFDGKIYTRHALTTGDYANINEREEMITRNVDSISYRFKDYFAPYIGVTNVTPSMESLLRFEVSQLVDLLKSEKATEELGGQLIGATIVRLSAHTIFKDRYVLVLNCQVPYPFNNFEVHLVI